MEELRSEERLIPGVRALVAQKLSARGCRVKEIASALNVTQAAVTQYLKQKRGGRLAEVPGADRLVEPLVEKLAKRMATGTGAVEAAELLETARQIMVMARGRAMEKEGGAERSQSLELLRGRLKLELAAAEKYLDLANKAEDGYTKLLLRMIASDSIRHGDVVSEVISLLEAGRQTGYVLPPEQILQSMLAIEDSADEANLKDSVQVSNPMARLLLEWIDVDEAKHGRMLSRMLALSRQRRGAAKG